MARVAGLELDQWQQDALELMLSIRADRKWACREYAEIVSRQNGKGAILEARALAGLFVLNEQLIMWSAHEVKTALEAFRRLKALLVGLGEMLNENLIEIDGLHIKVNNTNGSEGFELFDPSDPKRPSQRVKFIARSKGSGRGFSGDVNIIDEAFAYTDEQHSALKFTMAARPNPQMIYTSSPPLTGDTGPILFRLRTRAESSTTGNLGFRDWGAEGNASELGHLDLDSRDLWARTNPGYGIRIDEETVQDERDSVREENFAIERIGVWPKQISGGGAIDMGVWRGKLLDPGSKRHGDVALAVDIAPKRDYAAIGIYGNREDGLGHGQIVEYQPGTDWLVDAVVKWRSALDPLAVVMGRGTAASIEVELKKQGIARPEDLEKPKRGELHVLTATQMSGAVGQLLDAVKQGSFRHTGQRELDNSAEGARAKQNGDSLVWELKNSAADTSPIVTVTGARWGFTSLGHLVQDANYDVLESVY
ncbi:hypothetical protein [Amycolatopsis speibonae]|uniref:Terminase n=1 Tax=Amycolatopsis speibonae TaxID=1450224 RepID=A0ABV7P7G9_9PSEU